MNGLKVKHVFERSIHHPTCGGDRTADFPRNAVLILSTLGGWNEGCVR